MIKIIDNIDKRILTHLIENANITNKEISNKTGVSTATVHLRIKKMEQKGVIKGATLDVDYNIIGYNLIAYVGIIIGKTIESNNIMKDIAKIPEITVANITSGQFGALCKVRCKDTNHLKEIIFKINSLKGILRTESMISLEESVNDKTRLFKNAFDL